MGCILPVPDAILAGRFEEAGPAAVARELSIGPEQFIATDGAIIGTTYVYIPILPGEGALGSLFACYII